MKIFIAVMMVSAILAKSAFAVLAPNASLSIEDGSTFDMEVGFWIFIPVAGLNGINLGMTQIATGSHSGPVDGTENPDIDLPWSFFGNIGMHQSTTPVTVLSDDGAGNVMLDFSGWGATWNTIPNIDLGSGQSAGLAAMTCSNDCSSGDSYTLSYRAKVPLDDPSGFGGVNYGLNLSGNISEPVQPAGPLPLNTLLTIEPGPVPGGSFCSTGSCMFIEVAHNLDVVITIEPGTDGGVIIGRSQASGGQELGPSADNATPGEMNAAWYFFGAYGTLATLSGDTTSNIFHNESCVAAACTGKTEINQLYLAWNGEWLDLGGGSVDSWMITADDNGGSRYAMHYRAAVANGTFQGIQFVIRLAGDIILPSPNNPPVVNEINMTADSGVTTNWAPDFTDDAFDTHTCEISSNASNGNAVVNTDCSGGTYTSGSGYFGQDSFEYRVTDQAGLFATGIVTVNTGDDCGPGVPCPLCWDDFPLKQVTTVGGGQNPTVNLSLQTVFTGHIVTESGLTNGGRNTVKICPFSTVDFETISSDGIATCQINGAVAASVGTLAAGDKLICTNKPDGGDTDRFSIKSNL